MNLLEKIAIFLFAAVLILVGFSVMAAPAVELLKIGRLAGYQSISDTLAKAGITGLVSPYSVHLKLPIETLLFLAISTIVSFIVLKLGPFSNKKGKDKVQKPNEQRSRLGQFQAPDSRMGF